jgi:hypothetical protein
MCGNVSRSSVVVLVLTAVLSCGSPAAAQDNELLATRALTGQLPAARKVDEAPPANAVPSFAKSIGHDFRHLASKGTALTLGIGGALALAVWPADRNLTRRASGDTPVEETFDPGETWGSGWVQAGGAVGTYVIGRLSSNTRVQAIGGDLVRSQIVSGSVTIGLKHVVDRPRPDGSPYSFPSGHASAAFASATVLERHFGWKVGLPLYGAAAYAATSRLSENKHYASDVIFGAAVGIAAGRAVTVGRGANKFAVVPVAVPRGVAVTFNRIPNP